MPCRATKINEYNCIGDTVKLFRERVKNRNLSNDAIMEFLEEFKISELRKTLAVGRAFQIIMIPKITHESLFDSRVKVSKFSHAVTLITRQGYCDKCNFRCCCKDHAESSLKE